MQREYRCSDHKYLYDESTLIVVAQTISIRKFSSNTVFRINLLNSCITLQLHTEFAFHNVILNSIANTIDCGILFAGHVVRDEAVVVTGAIGAATAQETPEGLAEIRVLPRVDDGVHPGIGHGQREGDLV